MTSEVELAACELSALLTAQSSGGVRWDGDTSGPRALMLAVLEDAVRCIEEGHRRSRQVLNTIPRSVVADGTTDCNTLSTRAPDVTGSLQQLRVGEPGVRHGGQPG